MKHELRIARDADSATGASTSPSKTKRPRETIAAAAVCYDGSVYSMVPPARHHHILRAMMERDVDVAATDTRYQGFVTSTGRFVDRFEGARIARAAGQLIREPTPSDILTSEDVW